MNTSPHANNHGIHFQRLQEKAMMAVEKLASLNGINDKETLRIKIEINRMENVTTVDLILYVITPVSYQKVSDVIKAVQPVSWSVCSRQYGNMEPSDEKKLKLTLNMAYV